MLDLFRYNIDIKFIIEN